MADDKKEKKDTPKVELTKEQLNREKLNAQNKKNGVTFERGRYVCNKK